MPDTTAASATAVDPSTSTERLVRSALSDRWDPAAIDLAPDRAAVEALDRVEFTRLRGLLAQFGASEHAVTEDLAPFAAVCSDPLAQQFLATQQYDEVCHARLFDRYWDEVVRPEERARGLGPTDPTDDRWAADPHQEIVDRTHQAVTRLLETDEPAARAVAYAHYHLTSEGILAQVAYEWVAQRYSERGSEGPTLPGLSEGFRYLRRDESRHVSFGVGRVRALLADGAVDRSLVADTLADLLPAVQATVGGMARDGETPSPETLRERAETVRDRRLDQVTPEVTDAD